MDCLDSRLVRVCERVWHLVWWVLVRQRDSMARLSRGGSSCFVFTSYFTWPNAPHLAFKTVPGVPCHRRLSNCWCCVSSMP